jgi:hypothetical protein
MARQEKKSLKHSAWAVSVNAGAALVYSVRVMDAYEVNPASAAAASK